MTEKILCIDDEPEELFAGSSLRQQLEKLFGKKYGFLLEEDPEKAYELLHESSDIKVVLLDIEFSGDPMGSEIADTIYRMRPDIKIIVLTIRDHRGSKISLRQKKNVWEYFVKMDLEHAQGRIGLYNLVSCLTDDPLNKKWRLKLFYEDRKLVLSHPGLDIVEEITLRNVDDINTLSACLKHPGQCVNIIDIQQSDDFQLAKIVNRVNKRVRGALGWRSWGILDSKRCADNEVRILSGNKKIDGGDDIPIDLHEEIKEIKSRLIYLEQKLMKTEENGGD